MGPILHRPAGKNRDDAPAFPDSSDRSILLSYPVWLRRQSLSPAERLSSSQVVLSPSGACRPPANCTELIVRLHTGHISQTIRQAKNDVIRQGAVHSTASRSPAAVCSVRVTAIGPVINIPHAANRRSDIDRTSGDLGSPRVEIRDGWYYPFPDAAAHNMQVIEEPTYDVRFSLPNCGPFCRRSLYPCRRF
jgi:hypothetical protein